MTSPGIILLLIVGFVWWIAKLVDTGQSWKQWSWFRTDESRGK